MISTFLRRSPLLVAALAALAVPALAADYEVQPVAFSGTFTPKPTDTNRTFNRPLINNSGEVLFGGHWRDDGWQHNTLNIGRPGSVGRIATGGEAPPGNFANAKFAGGLGSRDGNFEEFVFNALGEFVFRGFLTLVDPRQPPPNPGGLWKGTRGDFGLLAGPVGVANLPYTGPGALEFDFAPGITPVGVSDDGPGYFIASVVAVEQFGRRVPVIQGGVFTSSFAGRRLIAYPGGPAPGLGGDYVFRSVGPVMMGQKNGVLAMLTTVILRGEPNPTVNSRNVIYEYRNDALGPIYLNGDPLPGLASTPASPPNASLVAVDETGSALLLASAAGTQGLWRHTPAGFVKVLLFGEDTPTPAGPARFLAPGSLSSFAMGGGRVAFIGSFTGVGVPTPRPAIIRETETGFEVVATGNQPVPGTNQVFIDFANQSSFLWMNAHREVAFFAGAREPTSVTTRRTLFVGSRDGVVRRVAYPPQDITVGGATRTVASVGSALGSHRVLGDSGAVALLLNFTDGTSAVARGVPPGYQDPPPPLDDYYFHGRRGTNWHASPLTNWEDFNRRDSAQAPGDGSPNRAAVFIPANFSVVLDQKPAPIGSIRSDGALAVSQLLTLNFSSSFNVLNVLGPAGGLAVRDSAVSANSTNWNSGTLALASSTFRSLTSFAASSGTIAGSATAVGTPSAFESRGVFEKRGVGEFAVQVPFHASAAEGVRVSTGTLALLGGGSFAGPQSNVVARGTTLRLAGAYSVSGNTTFAGIGQGTGPVQAGTLELGTATADATLTLAPGATLTLDFEAQTTRLNRGALEGGAGSSVTNQSRMVWSGGQIGTALRTRRLLEIEPGPVPRVVAGTLSNGVAFSGAAATVTQRASFQLDGRVENFGRWHITRSGEIAGTGAFFNQGLCIVELSQPGAVDIRAGFSNEELEYGSEIRGTLFVGSSVLNPQQIQTHAPADVRLHGRVRELTRGILFWGWWVVETGCTLTFPSPIEAIGQRTAVRLSGGSIPSLQLRLNGGLLIYENVAGSTPGTFTNRGNLVLLGQSTLTVNGDFVTQTSFQCNAGSRLIVNGDFRHERGVVENNGEVVATGSIVVADSGGGGTYVPGTGGTGGTLTFIGLTNVFASPGTLNVRGATNFAPTATLHIELAGTAAQRFDVLAVTGNVTLGGALQISLIENFAPASGDTFAVVQAAALAGQFLNVRSGQRLATTDGRGSFEVFYGAGSPRNPNHVVLANWQPSPAGFPQVSTAPASQTLATGDAAVLRVTAAGAGPLAYQWRFRSVDIPGATSATLTVPSVQPEHAGAYSVAVTNALGTTVTAAAALTPEPPPPSAARLLNVSTRALARAGDGDGALIPGFLLQGTESARLLIRAVGPQLATFDVAGVLPNPQMTVNRLVGNAYVDLATNNDWGTNVNAAAIAAAAATVGAFPLAADGLDSALLLDLAPGQYTVVAADTASRGGVGIVELYDAGGPATRARLANISTRAFVGAGADVMIPGFVISPEGSKTLLIRAVGPTLATFGVGDVLADPQFTLFQRQPGGTDIPILSNNDWGAAFDPVQTADVATQVGAFPLAAGSRDAALVATLPPGAYTVQISGVAGATGTALVEVYEVR